MTERKARAVPVPPPQPDWIMHYSCYTFRKTAIDTTVAWADREGYRVTVGKLRCKARFRESLEGKIIAMMKLYSRAKYTVDQAMLQLELFKKEDPKTFEEMAGMFKSLEWKRP